jgi:hypothetical protein
MVHKGTKPKIPQRKKSKIVEVVSLIPKISVLNIHNVNQ